MSELGPVKPRPLVEVDAIVRGLSRPSPRLLTLYLLMLVLVLPAAPFALLPMYFRYHTLRYRFDEDGVHASWGILFRREVSLTYARIQDIHLRRGLLERWLGIGSVQVQTASGSQTSELVIEGMTEYVAVRDFLYAKMRGGTLGSTSTTKPTTTTATAAARVLDERAVVLLGEIRDDLRAVREQLAHRDGDGGGHV